MSKIPEKLTLNTRFSGKTVSLVIPASDTRALLRRVKEYSRFDAPCRKTKGDYWIKVDDVGDCVGYETDTAVMYVVDVQPLDGDRWVKGYNLEARLRFSPLGDGRTLLVIESKERLWAWVQDIISRVYQLWPDTSRAEDEEKMPLPKLPYKSYDIILDSVLRKLGSDFTVTREAGALVRYRVAYQGEDLLEFTVGPSLYNENGGSFGVNSLIIKEIYGRTSDREDWTEKEKLLLGKARDVLRKVKAEMDKHAHWTPIVKSAIDKKKRQEQPSQEVNEKPVEEESTTTGIRPWRKKRAQLFKELKDQNPYWTQEKVASEAPVELQRRIRENHPTWDDEKVEAEALRLLGGQWPRKHTVRNDYAKMGWEWERGDRIR
jgi:hypothetical protein